MSNHLKRLRQNKITAYILFLVWPLAALMFALVNYRSSYSKNIVWFFCAFFGFTFIVMDTWDIDANRYKEKFEALAERGNESVKDLFLEEYVGKGIHTAPDFYLHGLTVVVSRFTDNFKIYFGIVGFIFGYFFSRNVFYILENIKDRRILILSGLLIFTTAFIIPFWSINGFRFRTAAHMFIFGALRVVVEKRRRYIWLLLCTPLVHFSMIFALIIFIIYSLLGNRINLYMMGLLISLLFANVDPSFINENKELAPIFLQRRVNSYSAEDYVSVRQEFQSAQNWYVRGHQIALNIVIYLMIFLLWLKRKRCMSNRTGFALFSFSILFLAISNIFSMIPSMDRFLMIATIFLFISIVFLIQHLNYKRYFSKLFLIFTPLILLFLIVEARISFDFIGLNTFLLNPLLAPFFPDSLPIIEYIK